MEWMAHFATTALGAVCGSYAAYRLSERRLNGREHDDYLALLIILHEHLAYLRCWLEAPQGKAADTGAMVFSKPLVGPWITPDQIQRLMEVSPDKDMPRTLIQILYFWKNAEIGIAGGDSFCMPEEKWQDIMKKMKFELASLRTQYQQERKGRRKFPSLREEDAVC